jgi:hypothetical protein
VEHRLDLGAVWDSTPLLLLMNAVLAVALLPAVFAVAAGAAPMAPFLAAACAGPVWAAIVAITDRLALDAPVSPRLFAAMLRRHWRRGIELALVPAVACSSLLTSHELGGALGAGSVVAALGAAVGLLLALPFAFSLATTAEMTGLRAWWTALLVAGFRPLRTLSVFALVAFAAALVTAVGPALVLVAPSLIALRCSMTVPFNPVEAAHDPS